MLIRQIANLSHEVTRNSISAQIKALSLIIAIERLIPDHRAGSSQKEPAPPAPSPQIYGTALLARQQETPPAPSLAPALSRMKMSLACPRPARRRQTRLRPLALCQSVTLARAMGSSPTR